MNTVKPTSEILFALAYLSKSNFCIRGHSSGEYMSSSFFIVNPYVLLDNVKEHIFTQQIYFFQTFKVLLPMLKTKAK